MPLLAGEIKNFVPVILRARKGDNPNFCQYQSHSGCFAWCGGIVKQWEAIMFLNQVSGWKMLLRLEKGPWITRSKSANWLKPSKRYFDDNSLMPAHAVVSIKLCFPHVIWLPSMIRFQIAQLPLIIPSFTMNTKMATHSLPVMCRHISAGRLSRVAQGFFIRV